MDDGRHVGHDLHGLLLDVAHGEVAVLLVTQVTVGRGSSMEVSLLGSFSYNLTAICYRKNDKYFFARKMSNISEFYL